MHKFNLVLVCISLLCNIANSQQSGHWYETFTGKMGHLNAVLHLTNSDGLNGYLWFRENQYPVRMAGEIKKDTITLESMSGFLVIELRGKFSKDSIFGTSSTSLFTSNSPPKKSSFKFFADSTSFTPFRVISVHASAHLSPKLNNKSTFQSNESTIWPVEKNIFTNGIKNSIKKLFVVPENEEIDSWLFQEVEKQKTNWVRKNSQLSPKSAEELGLGLSVQTFDQINVMYENAKTLTLAKFSFAYTGGAHGNYSTSLINISKSSGKVIHISDVLTTEGIEKLPSLLELVARVQFKADKGTLKDNGFFVDTIPVSNEFYITSRGIGFFYPPYALRSYADGEINLFIPSNVLTPYLKQGYK